MKGSITFNLIKVDIICATISFAKSLKPLSAFWPSSKLLTKLFENEFTFDSIACFSSVLITFAVSLSSFCKFCKCDCAFSKTTGSTIVPSSNANCANCSFNFSWSVFPASAKDKAKSLASTCSVPISFFTFPSVGLSKPILRFCSSVKDGSFLRKVSLWSFILCCKFAISCLSLALFAPVCLPVLPSNFLNWACFSINWMSSCAKEPAPLLTAKIPDIWLKIDVNSSAKFLSIFPNPLLNISLATFLNAIPILDTLVERLSIFSAIAPPKSPSRFSLKAFIMILAPSAVWPNFDSSSRLLFSVFDNPEKISIPLSLIWFSSSKPRPPPADLCVILIRVSKVPNWSVDTEAVSANVWSIFIFGWIPADFKPINALVTVSIEKGVVCANVCIWLNASLPPCTEPKTLFNESSRSSNLIPTWAICTTPNPPIADARAVILAVVAATDFAMFPNALEPLVLMLPKERFALSTPLWRLEISALTFTTKSSTVAISLGVTPLSLLAHLLS